MLTASTYSAMLTLSTPVFKAVPVDEEGRMAEQTGGASLVTARRRPVTSGRVGIGKKLPVMFEKGE